MVRAIHKYKKWKLAIKRCKLDNDREYRTAILRELKIMSSGHNNLIRLRDVSMWREEVWMAMDLQQCSVFAVLCQRGLPEQYTVYIANETLKALIYLHSKGIIHRDIKSENLLVGWKGEIKLGKKYHINQYILSTLTHFYFGKLTLAWPLDSIAEIGIVLVQANGWRRK